MAGKEPCHPSTHVGNSTRAPLGPTLATAVFGPEWRG